MVREHLLKNGSALLIRKAVVEEAPQLLQYMEAISQESDNLSFGPGEFGYSLAQEEETLLNMGKGDNTLFIVGVIDNNIVSVVTFSGGHRPRIRHRGEFGLSVRKDYWNLGIGGLMLDALIDWAKGSGVITKINLRVRCDNRPAIRLYETKGFLKEGTMRKDGLIRGEYFDYDFMGLEL